MPNRTGDNSSMSVEQSQPGTFQDPKPQLAQLDPAAVNDLVERISHASAATYFQSKLIQPEYSRLTFSTATGRVKNLAWNRSWSPQSIAVYCQAVGTVWVGTGGDPTGVGFPFGTYEAFMRVPLSGNRGSFVVALDPSIDLTQGPVDVHIFRYPTFD